MVAGLLLALALTTPPTAGESGPALDAALSLRGGPFHGSAVVWDARAGLLLTALHVVEEMPSVEVALPDGRAVIGQVVDREPWLDLALVAVPPDAALPEARPLRAVPLAAGQAVALSGCPALRCAQVSARVRTPDRRLAGARYVELDGGAVPGSSGGALLDGAGRLAGIVDLTLRSTGAALAIPIDLAAARFPRG